MLTETLNKILNDPRILAILPSLRDICSKGEFLLESVHAQRLLISSRWLSITL